MAKPLSYAPITLIEGEQGNGKSNTAVARVVDAYKKDPTIRIFCNFNLYGIPYVHATLAQIIEWLDAGIIRDGFLLIDEHYIGGNARESMNAFGKVLAKFSMTIRKRHLHVILIYPHERMADWIYRWAVTERILCSYDERNHMITLIVKKRKSRPKTIRYYAPQYWGYYDTDELPRLPAKQIGRAIEAARYGGGEDERQNS